MEVSHIKTATRKISRNWIRGNPRIQGAYGIRNCPRIQRDAHIPVSRIKDTNNIQLRSLPLSQIVLSSPACNTTWLPKAPNSLISPNVTIPLLRFPLHSCQHRPIDWTSSQRIDQPLQYYGGYFIRIVNFISYAIKITITLKVLNKHLYNNKVI